MRRTAVAIRTIGVALVLLGLLGVAVSITMAYLGNVTLGQVEQLSSSLDRERGNLAASLRSVSRTVGDAASATSDFQRSLTNASSAADNASQLATSTSGSFRGIAQAMYVQVLGYQPLVGLAPQFTQSADQLDQLSVTLATTRDSLSQNTSDVARVGGDLTAVQQEVDRLARTLDQSGQLVPPPRALGPYKVALFGMCLLFGLQSLFTLLAGWAFIREYESLIALGSLVRRTRLERNADPRTSTPPPEDTERDVVRPRRGYPDAA